jgi:hypothetical protein
LRGRVNVISDDVHRALAPILTTFNMKLGVALPLIEDVGESVGGLLVRRPPECRGFQQVRRVAGLSRQDGLRLGHASPPPASRCSSDRSSPAGRDAGACPGKAHMSLTAARKVRRCQIRRFGGQDLMPQHRSGFALTADSRGKDESYVPSSGRAISPIRSPRSAPSPSMMAITLLAGWAVAAPSA